MSLFGPTAFGGLYEQNGGILGGFGGMTPAQAQPQPFGISPDMLIALGAGIAGGKDWGQGIGAGLQGALGVKQANQARIDKYGDRNATFQTLLSQGMSPQQAWLMASNPQVAGMLNAQENRKEDVAWRQSESNRAQGNADRSAGLAERQFGLQQQEFNRPVVQMVEDENTGVKYPVLINRNNGTMTIPQGPQGAPAPGSGAPGNPYALPGKPTAEQSNAALYANRMVNSHNIINGLEGVNQGWGGVAAAASGAPIPGIGPIGDTAVGNAFKSSDRQSLEQAQRDFVNATLRRESGAAIGRDEFENARRQYFPQPGDSPEVISQKRVNREEAIKGIMGAAGRTYRPPQAFKADASRRDGVLKDARDAIAKGASRDAVLKRLKEMGIDGGL